MSIRREISLEVRGGPAAEAAVYGALLSMLKVCVRVAGILQLLGAPAFTLDCSFAAMTSASSVAKALNQYSKDHIHLVGKADGAALEALVAEYVTAPDREEEEACKTPP